MLKTFAYHKPSESGLSAIKMLREAFSETTVLVQGMNNSREKSIALTKLEEAAMWAIKGVVINDPESTVE